MSETWISTEDFQQVTGLPERTARWRIRRAFQGNQSHAFPLEVRATRGRGGRSGVRYEVALSSLSEDAQRLYRSAHPDIDVCTVLCSEPRHTSETACSAGRAISIEASAFKVAPNQGERIARKWRIIEDVVQHPRGSSERAAEIDRASQKWRVPVRTIQGWITKFERAGGDINALGRARPANAGIARIAVSRKFDGAFVAAGHSTDELAELGEIVTTLIKRGWTSPAQRAGWKAVRREVVTAFKRELAARGVELPAKALHLSQRRIMEAQHYRIVDIRANDRKRYDDMKPRIRRDNSQFEPMAQIVMDVKPIDNIVCRADGSTTWPKMIGFMDTGTHRLFRYFVMLAPGEGVRQEHIAEAFIAMVTHPEWGFPQQLYRDNGSEFFILDMVREALALINDPGARTIINAKPYSGASKPIESKFAVLDRFVFSQMGGWAGGNRMNKKTQTVGKPPKPYEGNFDQFVQEANERIEVFEHEEIGSGPFQGKSPQQIFADHVASGWRPVRVDPILLDSAFCKRDTRRVDRGALSIDGTRYLHPELPNGQTVPIALPWRRGALPLVKLPDLGWAVLQPEMHYLPGDIAGAIATARAQQRNDRRTRQLGHEAPPLDLASNHRDRVTALPTRAAPAPLIDLQMSEEAAKFAGARIENAAREAEIADPETARRRAIDAQTRRLERQYGSF